ncbi:MAG: CdaR family protein [Desulfuromonadales bacterium]|jgi:YbbR domain-containing protein
MFERLKENWLLKLLALAFAVTLWFFVMGERNVEVGYAVPLELKNVPKGLMVANDVPSLIDVRISGPRTLLMNLRPSDISITVDLSDLQPGVTSFKRLEERLNIPSGLKVTRLSPSFVDVKLERIRDKQVPVKVDLSGTPAEGFTVAEVTAKPAKLTVKGAESELKDVTEVETEPVQLDGVKESFSLMVPVDYRGKYTSLKEQQAVEVRVKIEPVRPPAPTQPPKPQKLSRRKK